MRDIECLYAQLRADKMASSVLDLPELRCTSLETDPECFMPADYQKLWHGLTAFGPKEGWVLCQSKIHTIRGSKFPALTTEDGKLLQAELLSVDGSSLHVTWMDRVSGWQATKFTEIDGEDYLSEEVQLLGNDKSILCYRRYWSGKDAVRPLAARFVGFGAAPK